MCDQMITVRVGQLPGTIQTVKAPSPADVKSVLARANINPSGYELRLDSVRCDVNTKVSDGQTILLVKAIKGNRLA